MRVIIGLGNPGPEYRCTRHNVGFWVVDRLAERWGGVSLSRNAFLSKIGETFRQEEKVVLVQPQTYMNRSGEAAAHLRDFYRLAPTDFVIAHDDLDLPLGRIRIKRGGGGGGNRGVASLIAELGSQDFSRVKVGIGRPPGRMDPVNFVLQPFTPLEEAFILPAVERAADAIEILLVDGLERAMALFNGSGQDATTEKTILQS